MREDDESFRSFGEAVRAALCGRYGSYKAHSLRRCTAEAARCQREASAVRPEEYGGRQGEDARCVVDTFLPARATASATYSAERVVVEAYICYGAVHEWA